MPEIFIQILEEEDPIHSPRVWQLREDLLRKPLGLSLRQEDPDEEAEDITFFACTPEDEVLGCLMLRPISTCALKLRQMAVQTGFQRQGIGHLLLQTAEAYAQAKGFRELCLHARVSALPFYEKDGYAAEGAEFTEVGIPHRFMSKTI